MRVDRHANHLRVDGLEFSYPIAKGNDLRRTNKGAERNSIRFKINIKIYLFNYISRLQVQRIEEEHQVFALVVGQLDLLKVQVDDGGSAEVGRLSLHVGRAES